MFSCLEAHISHILLMLEASPVPRSTLGPPHDSAEPQRYPCRVQFSSGKANHSARSGRGKRKAEKVNAGARRLQRRCLSRGWAPVAFAQTPGDVLEEVCLRRQMTAKLPLASEFYENDFPWELARDKRKAKWLALPISDPPTASEGNEQSDAMVWDGLYTRRGRLMFRERRYILQAFPLLKDILDKAADSNRARVFDLGCGAGATLLPIFDYSFRDVDYYANDVSPCAIRILEKEFQTRVQNMTQSIDGQRDANDLTVVLDKARLPTLNSFVWDLTQPPPIEDDGMFPSEPCDAGLLVFTLSAIAPSLQRTALQHCRQALTPGKGLLFFRDYGAFDMVQERCVKRIGDMTAIKQDGVQVTFFTLEALEQLFLDCGFSGFAVPPKFCTVRNVNRKEGSEMLRVFVSCVVRA